LGPWLALDYPLELQSYSLIAALRARVSPVITIVIVHLQPEAMYDQQHTTKTKWSRYFRQIGPTNLGHIAMFENILTNVSVGLHKEQVRLGK
jgi:hypothetical protein